MKYRPLSYIDLVQQVKAIELYHFVLNALRERSLSDCVAGENMYMKLLQSSQDIIPAYARDYVQQEMRALGNINIGDSRVFFNESPCSLHCAQTFLSLFFSDKGRMDAVLQYQQNRRLSDTPPSCIAFLTTRLEGGNICYISPSLGKGMGTLFGLFHRFLKEYQTQLKGQCHYSFALLPEKSEHNKEFSSLFLATNDILREAGCPLVENPLKLCSERIYSDFLATQYHEHGNAFQVEGASTVFFYPFHQDSHFAQATYNRFRFDPIPLTDGYFTGRVNCCLECRKSKLGILLHFSAAQRSGQMKKEEIKTEISLLAQLTSTTETKKVHLDVENHVLFFSCQENLIVEKLKKMAWELDLMREKQSIYQYDFLAEFRQMVNQANDPRSFLPQLTFLMDQAIDCQSIESMKSIVDFVEDYFTPKCARFILNYFFKHSLFINQAQPKSLEKYIQTIKDKSLPPKYMPFDVNPKTLRSL